MPEKRNLKPYWIRLAIVVGVSAIFVTAFNEITYLAQKDRYDQAPQTVQLVIPKGTAARIAAGEEGPSIPSEMVFVVGDVLEVINHDEVPHQLGPVWVPAGSTGRLEMNQADSLAYSCSFQSSKYLDVDIRQPTTMRTRLAATFYAAPTLAALVFLYSLLVFPVDKKQPAKLAA